MKKAIKSEEEIQKWRSEPPQTEQTLLHMKTKLMDRLGREGALPFLAKFGDVSFSNTPHEELEVAVKNRTQARRLMENLLSSKPTLEVTAQNVYRWQQMLSKCQEEIGNVISFVQSARKYIQEHPEPDITEAFFTSPQVITLFKGISEIIVVAKRVEASVSQHPQACPDLESPTLPSLPFLTDQVNSKWATLGQLLKELNHSTALTEHFEDTEQAPDMDKCCMLCLNPFIPNSKTLVWCETEFHSSCANFWGNRISKTAPC